MIEMIPSGILSILYWVAVMVATIVVFGLSRLVSKVVLYPLRLFLKNGRLAAAEFAGSALITYGFFSWFVGYLGLETSTVLILIAAGAAAVISLSSQGVIASVIAGIIVQSRRIIRTGDFVVINQYRGEVQGWDLFSLRLITVDNSHVDISWTVIAGSIIQNDSTSVFTPVEAIVPIPGEFSIDKAFRIIANVADQKQKQTWENWTTDKVQKYLDLTSSTGIQYPYVVMRTIGGNAIFFHAFMLVDDQDDRRIDLIHSDLLMGIFRALEEVGMRPGQVSDTTAILSGKLAVDAVQP